MRAADSSDRRAPAKGALLALLLLAAPGWAQDSGAKGDDVLGWLSGGSQEARPAAPATPPAPEPQPPPQQEQKPAPAPPPASDDSVFGWLSGGTPAADAPPAAADPAAATAPQRAPRAAATPATAAAQAYSDQLKQAMTLELQVQEYENSTLGAEEHPETLQAYKKQRWDRIQRDKAGFRQLAGQMSLQPLEVPRPAPGTQLSREALTLLSALQRGYDASRATRPVEQYVQGNQAFLKTADWGQRDHAVQLRDEIVDREVSFTRLMQDAGTLTEGKGDDDLVARMSATLDKVAPEARAGGDDLAVMVLKDPELRTQVMGEVTALIANVPPPPPPPAPDEELRPKVTQLQAQLVEQAQLAPVIEEHDHVDAQITAIDEQLKTDLPLERKKDLVGRRTAALTRSNELEAQWYGTTPDPDTFTQLTGTQDELIRRRLLDLGSAGVLYGQRADSVHADLGAGFENPTQQWHFLKQQQDLISLLDGVKPQENPLLGLTMPDETGAMLMKDAEARLLADQKLVVKSAPKPKAKAPPAPKAAPPAPKPKPMQHPHPHPHYKPPPKKKN